MTAHMTLTFETPDRAIDTLRDEIDVADEPEKTRRAISELHAALTGTRRGYVRLVLATAAASQTVTCDQSAAVDGTDDITIGAAAGDTISVEAAPSGEDEMDSGTTDAEFADNLAVAVNAHSVISKLVYAVSDGVSVVTLYAVMPGPVGNLISLTETGSGFVVGAALLAGGASDEVDGLGFGYNPAG